MDAGPPPQSPEPPPRPDEPSALLRWGTASLGLVVVAWRLLTVSPGFLWRDWALFVTLVSVSAVFAGRRRWWAAPVSAAMAFLLGIYVQGQWPHLLALFEGTP